jgi:hypothetical protein
MVVVAVLDLSKISRISLYAARGSNAELGSFKPAIRKVSAHVTEEACYPTFQ